MSRRNSRRLTPVRVEPPPGRCAVTVPRDDPAYIPRERLVALRQKGDQRPRYPEWMPVATIQ